MLGFSCTYSFSNICFLQAVNEPLYNETYLDKLVRITHQEGYMFKVKAKYLLVIAFVVWVFAGLNVLRLGILACAEGTIPLWALLIGIPLLFVLFHMMFCRILGKHCDRIRGYGEDRKHFLKFFDIKGYVFMVIMMGGGISLRVFGLIPTWFVAFFYTAIGIALTLAGIGFLIHYIKRGGEIVCPVTKKKRFA